MTAAAFAALIAGPAAAQTASSVPQTNTDNSRLTGVSGSSTATTNGNASMMGTTMSMNAEVQVTANAPIPDTPENRSRYGQPESRSGRMKLGEGPVRSLPNAGRAMATSRTSAQAE
jgi:hypothetical protein